MRKTKPKSKPKKRKQAVGKAVVGARTSTGSEVLERTEEPKEPQTEVERGPALSPTTETQSQDVPKPMPEAPKDEPPKPGLPLLISNLQFIRAVEDAFADVLLEEHSDTQLTGFCWQVQGFLAAKFFNVEIGPEVNVILLDGEPLKFCHMTARGYPTKQLCWVRER